jgi:mediator of RNA polymerase II transcription subunit 18
MHELFLCDIIPEGNMQQVMRILQGHCGMTPVSFIRREQLWEGPRNRNALKSLDQKFISAQVPEKATQWRNLSEALSRQTYMLTLSYEITRSKFGEAEGKDESELV